MTDQHPDHSLYPVDIPETEYGMVTETEHELTETERRLIAAVERLRAASELATATRHKGADRYGGNLYDVRLPGAISLGSRRR